jgi:uncharacterized cupredoxin-like copper-binding protein
MREDFDLICSTRRTHVVALISTLLLTLAFVTGAACGSDAGVEPTPTAHQEDEVEPGVVHTPPPGATTVDVTLKEWSIAADQPTVAAGDVYFLATNAGGEAHEMVVIKTDLASGALPETDGMVPEGEVDLIGEIEPFSPGSKASTVLELEPGNYVLICNIVNEEGHEHEQPSHYLQGMHTAFTVE